ncbi:hypothetical protein AAG570_005441 [Ranatra chinensis]|uniref:Uncharacterized protein n=1 Tax=Ranatra chinensis TaxID=642074 RepID=A0ABD0XXF9_9HEMI
MASKRRNMFQKNKTQETTENEMAISAQLKVQHLEDSLLNKCNLLDSLNEEKNSIFRSLGEANLRISEQESSLSNLKELLRDMEQLKIAAELKSVELEEKLEAEIREESNLMAAKLENEILHLKNNLAQQEALVENLNIRLSEKEKETSGDQNEFQSIKLISELDEWKLKCSQSESEIAAIQEANERYSQLVRELQLANEEIMRNQEKVIMQLDEKEKIVAQYKEKIEELVATISQNNSTISSLESELFKLKEEESKIRKQVHVETQAAQPDHQSQTQKLKILAKNLKMRTKMCQDLEVRLVEVNERVADLEHANNQLNEAKEALSLKVDDLEKELISARDRSVTESDIETLNANLQNIGAKYSNSLQEIENYKQVVEELKRELTGYEETVLKMQKEAAESSTAQEASSSLEIEKRLESLLHEKEEMISRLHAENLVLREQTAQSDKAIQHLEAIIGIEVDKNKEIKDNFNDLVSGMAGHWDFISKVEARWEQLNDAYLESVNCVQEKNKYVEELEKEIGLLKTKVGVLDANMEDKNKLIEGTVHDLGERLKQMEAMKERSANAQAQLIEKLSECSEKEESLNNKIEVFKGLVAELEGRNMEMVEKNSLLEQQRELSSCRIKELEAELEALKDIRSAYNNTLDQIEVLNEDLKQVMAEIESRNQELVSITEERRILIEKVAELEDTCSDLHSQLRDTESHMENLKKETELRRQNLDCANQEIASLQAQLSTGESAEFRQNEEVAPEYRFIYEDQIRVLRQEKDELLKLLKHDVTREVNEVMTTAEMRLTQMSASEEKPMSVFQWQDQGKENFLGESKDEDDGWGWVAPSDQAKDDDRRSAEIQELSVRVQELEAENNRLTEELRLSQKKCGALFKKVKEMKSRNEMLERTKTSSVGFEDLDFALQEEMRNEIDRAQQKVTELSAELKSLKTEKERLLKRIDTLTSANDELVQMKERQDIEVQMWQKRSNELKCQVQGLEWNLEELKATGGDFGMPTVNDSELEGKLTAVVGENEELQRIICDLKDRLTTADSRLKNLQVKETDGGVKEMGIAEESGRIICELTERLKVSESQQETLREELRSVRENEPNRNSEKMLNSFREELECVQSEREALSRTNEELQRAVSDLKVQLAGADSQLQILQVGMKEMGDYDDVNLEKCLNSVRDELAFLKEEKRQLLFKNEELQNANHDLEVKVVKYGTELEVLQEELRKARESQPIGNLEEDLNSARNELKKIGLENEELQKVIRDLKDSIASADSEMKLLQEEVRTTREDRSSWAVSMEQNLNSLREELEHVRQENEVLSKSNEEYNSACLKLGNEKDIVQASLNAIIDECDFFKHRITVLEENIAAMGNRIEEMAKEKAEVVERFNALAKEDDQLRRDILSSKSENESLKQIIENLAEDNNELKILLASSKDDLDVSVRRTGELETSVDRLSRKVVELEEEATKENQTEVQTQYQQTSAPRMFHGFFDTDPKGDGISDEILKVTLKEKDKELQMTRDDVIRLTSEKSELIDEFSVKLEAQKNTHTAEMDKIVALCRAEEQEILLLRERLEGAGKQFESWQGLLAENNEAVTKLNTECSHWKQEATTLSTQLGQLKQHLEETRGNFEAALKVKEETFRNELLNKEEENAHLVCELSSKEQQRQAEVAGLKGEVQRLVSELTHARAECDRIGAENATLKQQHAESCRLLEEVNHLNQVVAEKMMANEYLTQRGEKLEESVTELRRLLEDASTKVQSLEDKCFTLQASLDEKTEQTIRLEEDLRRASEDRVQIEGELEDISALLEDYKMRFRGFEGEMAAVTRIKEELVQRSQFLEEAILEKDQEIVSLQSVLNETQERLVQAKEANMTDETIAIQKRLDKALYTLHQTDVKCEELSLEIMQLLQERDMLQLKLSDALRLNERLKQYETKNSLPLLPSDPAISPHNDETSSQSSRTTTSTINEKLGELHSTYNRDPVIQIDRETRHTQQMHLYTQKNASAEEELNTSGDYGLLNWFFGSR